MRRQRSEIRDQRPVTGNRWPVISDLQARGVVGLTKAQMAAVLQISVRCLDGMMLRKEISFWRIGKRVVRFRIEDAVRRMNETVLVKGDSTEANEGNEGGTGE